MGTKHYIGLFFLLLMMASAIQPLHNFVMDTDIEFSDSMSKDSKDGLDKDLKSDLFLVVLPSQIYVQNYNIAEFKYNCQMDLNKGFHDIVIPPPEC